MRNNYIRDAAPPRFIPFFLSFYGEMKFYIDSKTKLLHKLYFYLHIEKISLPKSDIFQRRNFKLQRIKRKFQRIKRKFQRIKRKLQRTNRKLQRINFKLQRINFRLQRINRKFQRINCKLQRTNLNHIGTKNRFHPYNISLQSSYFHLYRLS